MEQLVCKSCGAPLESDGHCSYCGTRYKIDYTRKVMIETTPAQIRKLVATVSFDRRRAIHADEKELGEMAMKEIAREMADQLGSMIKYRTSYDYKLDVTLIRGELRVVEPDFRF